MDRGNDVLELLPDSDTETLAADFISHAPAGSTTPILAAQSQNKEHFCSSKKSLPAPG